MYDSANYERGVKIIDVNHLKNALNMKYDLVELKGNYVLHRQIEIRNGMTFMRMKRRPAIVVKKKENLFQ